MMIRKEFLLMATVLLLGASTHAGIPESATLFHRNCFDKRDALTKERDRSTGAAESIFGAIPQVAASKQTAVIDSLSVYLAMDPEARIKLYRDTIHKNEAGLKYLGELMYDLITQQL